MAKRINTTDDNGVEIGSEMAHNRTVTKGFLLSSRSADWPTDGEGKPVQLNFTVIIDMNGVGQAEILDDAIRTKVITLQNALRGTGKNVTPFETLKQMSKEPLRRHYNGCGAVVDNPEKEAKKIMDAFSNLTPEMREMLMKQLAEKA